MSKGITKKAAAKKTAAKAPKATRKVGVKTKTVTERAAAVESNLGGSQSLRDFLTGAGWY